LLNFKNIIHKNSKLLFGFFLVLNFISIWIIKIIYSAKSFDIIWFTWLQMVIVAILILLANINNTQVKNLYFSFRQKHNLGQRIINLFNNFGILSFPFYLVHSEIIYVVTRSINNPWEIAISFVISYFCAIIIYRLSSTIITKNQPGISWN
jgi:peptidoglycan/LPS O-acetylase OafA/YrhL